MKTQTPKTSKGIVKTLRKIRDKVSDEIKDMTFEEERAYLDKILSEAGKLNTPTLQK